ILAEKTLGEDGSGQEIEAIGLHRLQIAQADLGAIGDVAQADLTHLALAAEPFAEGAAAFGRAALVPGGPSGAFGALSSRGTWLHGHSLRLHILAAGGSSLSFRYVFRHAAHNFILWPAPGSNRASTVIPPVLLRARLAPAGAPPRARGHRAPHCAARVCAGAATGATPPPPAGSDCAPARPEGPDARPSGGPRRSWRAPARGWPPHGRPARGYPRSASDCRA